MQNYKNAWWLKNVTIHLASYNRKIQRRTATWFLIDKFSQSFTWSSKCFIWTFAFILLKLCNGPGIDFWSQGICGTFSFNFSFGASEFVTGCTGPFLIDFIIYCYAKRLMGIWDHSWKRLKRMNLRLLQELANDQ